uniref:Uncharacterized protein n=1 Tax=Tetranychus urticae TaxID=32264 RepID=T1JSY2_TETUR
MKHRWMSYTLLVLYYVQVTQEWSWWKGSDDDYFDGGCGGCKKGCGHHFGAQIAPEKNPFLVVAIWIWCASHDDHWGGGCKGHKSHKSHKWSKGHKGWDDDDDDDDHWHKKKKKKSECGWCSRHYHRHHHHGAKKGKKAKKEKHKPKKKKHNHDIIILNDGDHWGHQDHWDHNDHWDNNDHWDHWDHGHKEHGDVWAWVDGDHKKSKKKMKGTMEKFDKDVDNYIHSIQEHIGVDRKDVAVNGDSLETRRINQLTKMKDGEKTKTVKQKKKRKFLGFIPIPSLSSIRMELPMSDALLLRSPLNDDLSETWMYCCFRFDDPIRWSFGLSKTAEGETKIQL